MPRIYHLNFLDERFRRVALLDDREELLDQPTQLGGMRLHLGLIEAQQLAFVLAQRLRQFGVDFRVLAPHVSIHRCRRCRRTSRRHRRGGRGGGRMLMLAMVEPMVVMLLMVVRLLGIMVVFGRWRAAHRRRRRRIMRKCIVLEGEYSLFYGERLSLHMLYFGHKKLLGWPKSPRNYSKTFF